MSVQDALAGMAMLQDAFEKKTGRKFDLEKLLMEQSFKDKEQTKALKSAEKIAGIHITPEMKKIAFDQMMSLKGQAAREELSAGTKKQAYAEGSPITSWTSEKLGTRPNAALMALSIAQGIPQESAGMTAAQAATSIPSDTALMGYMNSHLATLKEGPEKTAYMNMMAKTMQSAGHINELAARNQFTVNSIMKGGNWVEQPIDLNRAISGITGSVSKIFPDYDGSTPLADYNVKNFSTKQAKANELQFEAEVEQTIRDQYQGTPLGEAASAKLAAAKITSGIYRNGYSSIYEGEYVNQERGLLDRAVNKYIKAPLEKKGLLDSAAVNNFILDKTGLSNEKYGSGRIFTVFKSNGKVRRDVTVPLDQDQFIQHNWEKLNPNPVANPKAGTTPAATSLFQSNDTVAKPSSYAP